MEVGPAHLQSWTQCPHKFGCPSVPAVLPDKKEKKNREAYIHVYQEIFKRCSPQFPWIIVPSDQKWFRNYLVAKKVVEQLEALDMKYPD